MTVWGSTAIFTMRSKDWTMTTISNHLVLVCGSRGWNDYERIRAILLRLREYLGPFTVLHGGARGADTYAGLAAALLDIPLEVMLPDWSAGKSAGFLRNTAMLERSPAFVIAFTLGTSGTADTIDKAINTYRIPTLIYRR